MSKFFTGGLHNERSSLNYAEEKITCKVKRLTVRTLKPGDLKEDCPISTFSENKRFLQTTNNIHKLDVPFPERSGKFKRF